MDEAAAELERARELAEHLLPAARVEYTAATAALGWVYNQQVRFDDAARLADEALATLGEADDVETAKLLVLRRPPTRPSRSCGASDGRGPSLPGGRPLAHGALRA
jgi:hypothetical protein